MKVTNLLQKTLIASVLGLGSIAMTAYAATPADTIVIGKPADPQTLDPAVTIDNNDWTVTYPSYQRLMRYKQVDGVGSTEVEGELAASWEASADNLEWVFKLNPGQKFADGTVVDAHAVKASFDRLIAKKQGPSEAFPSDMEITAVDNTTVKFKLQQPYAPFLYTLANNGASIINPNVLKRDDADAWLAANTAGSGAYQLTSWQKGQSLVLERNPNYAGDKSPVMDKFIVNIVPEASARRLQLEKGDLDVAEELPVDQLKALSKVEQVNIAEFPSLRVTYLYLNNGKGPLQNKDVRKAVVSALDYDGIVNGIMLGQAKQMRGPIPEGLWGHDETIEQPKQDVAGAKALLEGAGGVKDTVLLRYSTQDPAWEPIALTVQANLSNIGVNVKLEKLANATLRENIDEGNFDITMGNWSPDFADPYMFTSYWFDSDKMGLAGNRAFYANDDVDSWLREAATLSDQDKRVDLYKKVQAQVVSDAAYAYLYQKNYQVGLNANLKGFVFNPMLERVFNISDMSK